MGTLRTLLALLVVCNHLLPMTDGPSHFVTGGAIFAVKAFFILSGFYMALVLHTQYRYRPVRFFYASRLSRLLPLYWFVGILTLLAEALLVPRGKYFYPLASPMAYGSGLDLHAMPWPILLYIAISVGTMLGLDTGQWMGFSKDTGAIGFFPEWIPRATSVMALSPVPAGWTIGLELLFYFMAPYLVRRATGTILLVGAASLGFRFGGAWFGLSGDPWNRALFPSELIFFLMGILAFRLYLRLPVFSPASTRVLQLAPIATALLIIPAFKFTRLATAAANGEITINVVHISTSTLAVIAAGASVLIDTVPYIVVAVCIPFLFNLTKNSVIDNRIGDLSYPIYIGHMFVMGAVQLILPIRASSTIGSGWAWLLCNLAVVIIVAAGMDRFIAAPIDGWRRRFGARTKDAQLPALGSAAAAATS